MTLAAGQVRIASGGELSIAPVATTAPVDASTALAAGFVGMGYNSDSGLTLSRAVNTNSIMAWQTIVPVRLSFADSSLSISGEFLQSNNQTIEMWYQSATFATAGTGTGTAGDVNPGIVTRSVSLDWTDGSVKYRLYVPNAQVTPNGDQTLSRAGAVLYPLMFTALAPNTGTTLFNLFTNDATDVAGT